MEGYKNVSISHKVLASDAAEIDMHHRCRHITDSKYSAENEMLKCNLVKDSKVFQWFLKILIYKAHAICSCTCFQIL